MCKDEGLRKLPSNRTVVDGVPVELSAFPRGEAIPFLNSGMTVTLEFFDVSFLAPPAVTHAVVKLGQRRKQMEFI